MTVNDLFEMLRAGGLVPRGDAYELAERVYVALSASAVSGAADPVASAAGEQPGPVSAAPTREGVGGLPEPVAWQKTCPHVTHLRTAALMADTPEEFDGLDRHGWAPLYTADQMRAAIAAERERCRRASCQPSADTQAQLDDWERAIRPAQGGVRAEAGRRVLEQIVSGAAPALSDEDLADCGLLSELDP